jgi:hypothetical protein
MAQRSGSAILPLHGGRVPPWLATRMSSLGAVVAQAIVHHYGRDELRRLSHPFWFQSFGAVMGMDWHSSGITTSVIGALARARTALERTWHSCLRWARTAFQKDPGRTSLAGRADWVRRRSADARKPSRRQGLSVSSRTDRKKLHCLTDPSPGAWLMNS